MAAHITVVCPNCKHRMRASAEHIGRKGRCPACGGLVEIQPALDELMPALATASSAGVMKGTTRGAAGTEVNAWVAGLIGVVATVLLYGFVFLPVRRSYLGRLMLERGPIQYAIALVTCWGLSILAMKYWEVRRQLSFADRELELIPLDIGVQITPANVDQFLDHLAKLPEGRRHNILVRRIQGALEHFKSRVSVPEVQGYLGSQSELDASAVDSGYTLLRAFIWVCPILGFIGTVTGISDAVTGLAASLPSAEAAADLDAGKRLMDGMGIVTGGLAIAFDTTLLGLICVILLLFPTETLRKTEYAMLDRIEEFANESLLRRMAEGKSAGLEGEMPGIVRNALESAFQQHQQWLARWQQQVARLGQEIGADFESAIRTYLERAARTEAERLQRIQETADQVAGTAERVVRSVAALEQAESKAADGLRTSFDHLDRLHAALAENARHLVSVLEQHRALAAQAGSAGRPTELDGLERDVRQLVEHLAGHRAAEPAVAPRRAGIFARVMNRQD